jgi:uncharacterized membrane protein YgaE (UPF0421/DUF939 family)
MSRTESTAPAATGHLAAVQLAVRAAVAAALAVALARALDLHAPLYAMIGAVIVTDLSPATTRQLGAVRFAGTVLGATTGAALSGILPAGPVAIGLSLAAAMLLSHFLRFEGAARVTGFICAIVILDHQDAPWSYALDRLLETMLGIGMALAVSLVPLLVRRPENPVHPDPDKPSVDGLW